MPGVDRPGGLEAAQSEQADAGNAARIDGRLDRHRRDVAGHLVEQPPDHQHRLDDVGPHGAAWGEPQAKHIVTHGRQSRHQRQLAVRGLQGDAGRGRDLGGRLGERRAAPVDVPLAGVVQRVEEIQR